MFPEALLGAVVGALIAEIIKAKEKAIFFKKTLEQLESTLNSVYPIVCEILKKENVPTDSCDKFVEQLEKAKVLVKMYHDMKKWKLLKKRKVKKLIQEMEATLRRFLVLNFQVEQLRFLAIIMEDICEMNKKMDHVINLLEGNYKAIANTTTSGYESNPETAIEDTGNESKPTKSAFELHLKSKEKCLDILFWRHHD